jgi:hypothetical protein
LGSVLTAETLAARDGLLLTAELAVERIVLEIHNLIFCDLMKGNACKRPLATNTRLWSRRIQTA